MALFAFAAAGAVTILAVALIVLALVFYLVSIILELRKITTGLNEVIGGVGEIVDKSVPVNGVVKTINQHLDSGVDLLEGLLVKKAGMDDAVGLVEGLYPGSAAAGFRKFPASATTKAPRIGTVYTKGVLTLARLGREAPIAAASPSGPALRNPAYGSSASAKLYPEARQTRPASMPKSPVVGTGAPVQYHADTISWKSGGGSEPAPPAAASAPAAQATVLAAQPTVPGAQPTVLGAQPTVPGAQPTVPGAQPPDDPQQTKISWKRR
jgi:uncharacterized protein YoxC